MFLFIFLYKNPVVNGVFVMKSEVYVHTEELFQFTKSVLSFSGLSEKDAKITSNVLIAADKRGIASHGVARLKRYLDAINNKVIDPKATSEIIKETPVSLLVDGHGGMGAVVAYKTMNHCIRKAKENYICFASVRNSNHYGIAGFYSLMALKEDLIGFSTTNSAPLVVPTFAKDAVIGTNPISIGFPGKNTSFLLDMATSTVPRGKLEVYTREDKQIPLVWATDENGMPTTDPKRVLENVLERKGGGLLPLGGSEEETGGHKGYGLSVMVDLLTGGLSNGAMANRVYKTPNHPSGVCHFFGAIHPDAFCGIDSIKSQVDWLLSLLHDLSPAGKNQYVYVAGEKEFNSEKRFDKIVPLQEKVFDTLVTIGSQFDISLQAVKKT
jgi:L-2-hydroxycarboxylate dehydrogenase (NAD+)